MDRDQLRAIQSRRLVRIVDYVYHNTPFYRQKFQEMGLEPGDIKSIDDISKLPFTQKTDLRDHYPFGFAAVPMSQIVRIHASSGTTGKPVVALYTRKDLATWTECLSRAFTAYGAGKTDIVDNVYCYDYNSADSKSDRQVFLCISEFCIDRCGDNPALICECRCNDACEQSRTHTY